MRVNKLSTVSELHSKGLIKPPPFVLGGTCYETIMGSLAYGVSGDASDMDVYGFCIPPKETVFPHLAGQVQGFGRQIQKFDQFQQHHILDKNTSTEYDINIYNIVKYFQLCMENNPNMIDSLFTRENMVLFSNRVGQMVKDNRRIFLHKGSWYKFKGYAYSQMQKMNIKEPDPNSKRYELIQKFGYDVKFAYHIVRLLDEAEQIMIEGDIDLMKNNDQLKAIRRGEWSKTDIETYFFEKEKTLEKVYAESKLQHSADEAKIKKLLLDCLEEYYGNLNNCVIRVDEANSAINEIKAVIQRYGL